MRYLILYPVPQNRFQKAIQKDVQPDEKMVSKTLILVQKTYLPENGLFRSVPIENELFVLKWLFWRSAPGNSDRG